MKTNLVKYTIKTSEKQSFTNIDRYLEEVIKKSNVKDGIVVVYCPHTTAGITINENADPDVKVDLKKGLNDAFPNKKEYIHMEGNSDGHMKSSLIGVSETMLLSNGQLIVGMWQSVYFCEFDGPRTRTFYVKVIEG